MSKHSALLPANIEDDRLLTTAQVVELTGVCKKTLEAWRYRQQGLPCVRLGRCVRYKLRDVRKYLDQNTSQSAAGAR